MRRTPALLAASALLVLVSACGGSGETESNDPEPSGEATEQKGSAQCHDLLPQDEVDKLAGAEMLDPQDSNIGGLEACRWDGVKDPGASITVVRAPSEQWAQKLPALIDQYEKTGALEGKDQEKIDRARELIESDELLTGEQACGVFTTMVVELQGLPEGSTEVTNWLPTQEKPQALNVQTCQDGLYTSLQLVSSTLKGTAAEEARLREAYDALPG